MSFFEPENLRRITGGAWLRPPRVEHAVSGVGIDTRESLRGRAFVAICGQQHDGHDFVDAAIGAGAGLLIVERALAMTPGGGEAAVLIVENTRAALGQLASAYRQALTRTTVIGITGSCGKTTTRHLLQQTLETQFRGTAAIRSFNNDIGVPLTILQASPADDYLIVEIGANRPGEVAALSAITAPDLAIITMVGRAHLEGFKTIEVVAREKGAILEHVAPGGLGIVNVDWAELGDHLGERRPTIQSCGVSDKADLQLTSRDQVGCWFEVNGRERFEFSLPGEHNALNALLVIAAARHLSVTDANIRRALARCAPAPMRMCRTQLGGIEFFNDAYNANPDSMIASMRCFLESTDPASRRIVVLGEMRELGSASARLHFELIETLVELTEAEPIDQLILVGGQWRVCADRVANVSGIGSHFGFDDVASAAESLTAALRPGDVVLLKGSRAMKLERLIDAVRDFHTPACVT